LVAGTSQVRARYERAGWPGDVESPLMPMDEIILIMETVDAVLGQALGDA
jgi:hypothetical protein